MIRFAWKPSIARLAIAEQFAEEGGDFMQVNGLLLQRPPQPFDEDVVEIAAPAIHRDFDVGLGQSRDPACACVLAALIRIHYFRLSIFCDSLLQSLNAKDGIQRIGMPPGQNLTGRSVHNRHQIQKVVLDRNVGNVATPNLVLSEETRLK
jgi:hypothetical protein